MEVGRNHDAEPGAGHHVNMWIDAPLADQSKAGQPLQKRRSDLRPLSEKHKRFRVVEPSCQGVGILDMIVPYFDFVAIELFEAFQGPQRVVIVVQDGYFHARCLTLRVMPTLPERKAPIRDRRDRKNKRTVPASTHGTQALRHERLAAATPWPLLLYRFPRP